MPKKRELYKKRLYDFTEEIIDRNTGEIKKTTKRFVVKTKKDNFYLTYIDNLSGYLKVTSNIDKAVLAALCCAAEYDTGRVLIYAEDRKSMCDMLGISSQQMTNSISTLKHLKLLTGERGIYMINPAVFWKGTSRSREQLLRDSFISIEFNFELEDDNPNPNIPPQNI